MHHHLGTPAHSSVTPAALPPYLVSPRFLAGLDDGDVGPVIRALTDAGWTAHDDDLGNVRIYDPSIRLTVEFVPEALNPPRIENQRAVWMISASPTSDAPPAWTALFTNDVPNEILLPTIAALAAGPGAALTVPPYPIRTITENEPALAPLAAAGWAAAPDGAGRAYESPGRQASFAHRVPPAHAVPNTQDRPCWTARARYTPSDPAQWAAHFGHTTPTHVLTAFTAAMADPAPVYRYELPPGAEQHLTHIPAR